MGINKLCLFCKHFFYDAAEYDWSEVTPGNDIEISCEKGFWAIDIYEDNTKSYRRKMLQAKTCPAYEFDVELLEDDEGID